MVRCLSLALVLITVPLLAGEPPIVRAVRQEAQRYLTDAGGIATAPLHWDERTWKQVALILAADGAAFAVDEEVAEVVQRNRTPASEDLSRFVTPLGGGRGLQLAAATFVTGLVLRKPELRDTGREAVEASFLASGIITPTLKRIAGRTRPNGGDDASFPSGHATNAFAIASVFAARSEGRVVPTIAYTLATAVAVARVHDNVHYTSDVFAGAVIGTAVGRSLVARHRRAATAVPRVTWMVVPMNRGLAVQVAVAPETLARFVRRH